MTNAKHGQAIWNPANFAETGKPPNLHKDSVGVYWGTTDQITFTIGNYEGTVAEKVSTTSRDRKLRLNMGTVPIPKGLLSGIRPTHFRNGIVDDWRECQPQKRGDLLERRVPSHEGKRQV